jgi:hypothetical protein
LHFCGLWAAPSPPFFAAYQPWGESWDRDLAAFAVTKPAAVFVILDLEVSQGYAIAKELDTKSAEMRQIIAERVRFPPSRSPCPAIRPTSCSSTGGRA